MKKNSFEDMVSVTKVIAETKPFKDREALEIWRSRVGEEEAEKISKEAIERGRKIDADFKELHITGKCKNTALSNFMIDYRIKARELAVKSGELGINGRLDAVLEDSLGSYILTDLKGASRLKKREHIEDYFLQIGGYNLILAIENIIKIHSAKIVIFIGEQKTPQVFRLNTKQIEGYSIKFYNRLKQYRESQLNK
tara:strand:+ start:661 stop:1248 length:588 start_codon:yes stop_codon:yes gene_type:complete